MAVAWGVLPDIIGGSSILVGSTGKKSSNFLISCQFFWWKRGCDCTACHAKNLWYQGDHDGQVRYMNTMSGKYFLKCDTYFSKL